MRPSRIFGSLTPSREGSRLTSTHLHAGFTRESDVRRESDVKRNIASRVRAHASRLSQTWGVSRKFASRVVTFRTRRRLLDYYRRGREVELDMFTACGTVHSCRCTWPFYIKKNAHDHSRLRKVLITKNIKYSTKFTTISWFLLNSFFKSFFLLNDIKS